MPFGLNAWERGVVLLIVLLIFGVGRLPEVGQALGRGFREFRRAVVGEDKRSDGAATESGEKP